MEVNFFGLEKVKQPGVSTVGRKNAKFAPTLDNTKSDVQILNLPDNTGLLHRRGDVLKALKTTMFDTSPTFPLSSKARNAIPTLLV